MKTKPRTRAQWAKRINAMHRGVVASCFKEFQKLGRELLAAKRALPHGEFLLMVESDLTVGARAAQILMRVVGRFGKYESDSYLPKAVSVLHELTKLPDEAIEQGIKDGTINPQMTRNDAKVLKLKVVQHSHKIVSPYYVSETPEPPRVVVPHYISEPTPEPQHLRLVVSPEQSLADSAVLDSAAIGSAASARSAFLAGCRSAIELATYSGRGDSEVYHAALDAETAWRKLAHKLLHNGAADRPPRGLTNKPRR